MTVGWARPQVHQARPVGPFAGVAVAAGPAALGGEGSAVGGVGEGEGARAIGELAHGGEGVGEVVGLGGPLTWEQILF